MTTWERTQHITVFFFFCIDYLSKVRYTTEMCDVEITVENDKTMIKKWMLWFMRLVGQKEYVETLALVVKDNPESGKPKRRRTCTDTRAHTHLKRVMIYVMWTWQRLWLIILLTLPHGWTCPPVSKGLPAGRCGWGKANSYDLCGGQCPTVWNTRWWRGPQSSGEGGRQASRVTHRKRPT